MWSHVPAQIRKSAAIVLLPLTACVVNTTARVNNVCTVITACLTCVKLQQMNFVIGGVASRASANALLHLLVLEMQSKKCVPLQRQHSTVVIRTG